MPKCARLLFPIVSVLCVLPLMAGCPQAAVPNTLLNSTLIETDGGTISGVLTPGKVDYYRFRAVADGLYEIETDSNIGLTVSVLDRNGRTLLEHQTDSDRADRKVLFLFRAEMEGDYYVVVQGASQIFDTRYYTLTVTARIDDYGNTPETATPITIDAAPIFRYVLAGGGTDRDVFSFAADAGQVYTIQTYGPTHVALSVLGSDAQELLASSSNNFSDNQKIPFFAPTTGVYYIFVKGFESGGYQLSVTTPTILPETGDYSSDPNLATGIMPNGDLRSGSLTQDDQDFFSFQATAGRYYVIQTVGELATFVTVYDVDGVTILSMYDELGQKPHNAYLVFFAPESGTYYVDVSPYRSTDVGDYILAIDKF